MLDLLLRLEMAEQGLAWTDPDMARGKERLGRALADWGWRLFGHVVPPWDGVASWGPFVVVAGVPWGSHLAARSGRQDTWPGLRTPVRLPAVRLPWPEFSPNPPGAEWHLERDREVLGSGKGVRALGRAKRLPTRRMRQLEILRAMGAAGGFPPCPECSGLGLLPKKRYQVCLACAGLGLAAPA